MFLGSKRNYTNVFVYFVCVLLFVLPFFRFGSDLYIGGDDSRLFYTFPIEWIRNIGSYGWLNFSSFGAASPQYFILPFLFLLTPFEYIGLPAYIIQNILVGVLLSGGFYFLYKFFLECSSVNFKIESLIVSLFFILSPIIYLNQIKVFLYPVWLLLFIPLFLFLSSRYFYTGTVKYLVFIFLCGLFGSIAFSQIPWVLGIFFPLCITILLYLILEKRGIKRGLKRIFVIFSVFFFSQLFWVIPFTMTSFGEGGMVTEHVLTNEMSNTFFTTVDAVSKGNTIINPLLNHFNYGLFANFNSPVTILFDNFYNYTSYFSLIYLVVFFIGLFGHKRKLDNKIFIPLFIGFLFVLFLFTVKIGIFYNLFIGFGNIPGFVMFRNFFDKFAVSYVLFYSFLLFYSLIILRTIFENKKKIYKSILFFIGLSIGINAIPFFMGILMDMPLWTTQNIKTNIKIPKEYTDFMLKLKNITDTNGRIFILPYGISSYSYILGEGKNSIFQGRSPVELFTKRQDLSGRLSLGKDSETFENMVLNEDYNGIKNFLKERGVKYVLYFPRLPAEFLKSYLFDKTLLEKQNNNFLTSIVGKKLLQSSHGNYVLFSLDGNPSGIVSFSGNYEGSIDVKSPVQYNVSLSSLKESQTLLFANSYSPGRKLFLKGKLVFEDTHQMMNNYLNQWTIDADYIKKNFSKEFYKENPDGSIDVNLTLYFKPQSYFYLGLGISGLTLVILLVLRMRELYFGASKEK